jgi:ribosome recycling factor
MIAEELQNILDEAELAMEASLEHLTNELNAIRAGRAAPRMLDTVRVEYYGTQTPLNQVASVSAPSHDLLLVQPWDKSVLADVERAIISANLGLNPSNDGEVIRIPVPPLSGERRQELVKATRTRGEEAKVSIRNARRHARDVLKSTAKDHSLPEDMRFECEEDLQELTKQFEDKVDHALSHKEEEILEV